MLPAGTPPPETHASKYARKVALRRQQNTDRGHGYTVSDHQSFVRPPYYIKPT